MATTPQRGVPPAKFEDRWNELEPHFQALVSSVYEACRLREELHTQRDLLNRLAAVNDLKARVESTVRDEVRQLRSWSIGWPQIGDALNMTRQGARQKYEARWEGAIGDEEELWDLRSKSLLAQLDVEVEVVRQQAIARGEDPGPLVKEVEQTHFRQKVLPEMRAHAERLAELRTAARQNDREGR